MTDEKVQKTEQTSTPQPEKPQSSLGKAVNLLIGIAVFAAIIYFLWTSPGTVGRIGLVVLGFGAVVFIHELGHFLVAKLGGIKVEAFSIGFPPTILAVRKLKKGWRIRFLPRTEPEVEEGDDETEYWLGMIPVGGFVKMLGQSDSGVAEKTDDPRSYLNKPISTRIAVVAAGVTFNAISAVILFMGLYLYGLPQYPALVGGVQAGSPAAAAGLRAGDRIIAIDGKSFLGDFVDYTTVAMAGALSDPGEPVQFTVERTDGRVEEIEATAEYPAERTMGLRAFGIEQASTLRIDPEFGKNDPNAVARFYDLTGLRPGDEVIAVDGERVEQAWEMEAVVRRTLKRQIELTVSRTWPKGAEAMIEKVTLPLFVPATNLNFSRKYDLANAYTMVPRLKVEAVSPKKPDGGLLGRVFSIFGKAEKPSGPGPNELHEGDVILRVGDVAGPTLKEVHEVAEAHRDKPLEIEVLRGDQTVTFTQIPRLDKKAKRVLLGFSPGLDLEHAAIAKTISAAPREALNIPAGAQIVKVDGQEVKTFYEIIEILRANPGQRVGIDYRAGDGGGGSALIEVPEADGIQMHAFLGYSLPFSAVKETVKTSNPGTAIALGVKKTKYFIVTTYVTFIRLFERTIPTSALSGPVGILRISYVYTQQSFVEFLSFLGLISACLAFMNLLPIPVVDGGVIVLLIVEKLKGGPLPEKVHAGIMYAGWLLILAIFVAITYNDIMQIFR